MNAGIFDALHVEEPRGTFLFAEYPRPVAGCSAEVSQRIAEAVFAALVEAIPDKHFAASAGHLRQHGDRRIRPEKARAVRHVLLHGRRLRRERGERRKADPLYAGLPKTAVMRQHLNHRSRIAASMHSTRRQDDPAARRRRAQLKRASLHRHGRGPHSGSAMARAAEDPGQGEQARKSAGELARHRVF